MPSGRDAVIVEWIEENPNARLIIVDTFEKMPGRNPQGVSAYAADYAAAGRFKTIADNCGVPILLIHHVRKQAAEDWQELVSGTNGLTGAVDVTLVLERSRGQADGVLHVTGRDVVESDVRWDVLEQTRRARVGLRDARHTCPADAVGARVPR